METTDTRQWVTRVSRKDRQDFEANYIYVCHYECRYFIASIIIKSIIRTVTYLDLYLTIMIIYFTTNERSQYETSIIFISEIDRKTYKRYIIIICFRKSWTICERVDDDSSQRMSLFFLITRSRDLKIWVRSSSILSMSWNRISRICSQTNGDNEDLSD